MITSWDPRRGANDNAPSGRWCWSFGRCAARRIRRHSGLDASATYDGKCRGSRLEHGPKRFNPLGAPGRHVLACDIRRDHRCKRSRFRCMITDEPCSVLASVPLTTAALTRFVSRSLARQPRWPCQRRHGPRVASCARVLVHFLAADVSLVNLHRPCNGTLKSSHTSRSLCPRCHAELCAIPRSRCSFMLETPLRLVVKR